MLLQASNDHTNTLLSSCRTVALMVLDQFSDICGPYGYGFHPIKNFRNCAVKMLRRFFTNFCHEIGCENDQTNVSILTDPAYFVPPFCHCGILALRSRDL